MRSATVNLGDSGTHGQYNSLRQDAYGGSILLVNQQATPAMTLQVQPGIYYIAQEARLPMVPVFIGNMQLISTKTGRFHPLRGLRKVEVHFGDPIAPENSLPLPRETLTEFIRESIASLRPAR